MESQKKIKQEHDFSDDFLRKKPFRWSQKKPKNQVPKVDEKNVQSDDAQPNSSLYCLDDDDLL